MNAEQKLAALEAEKARKDQAARDRSERARKKAREAGRVPVNLILSERSRRVLDVLAGQFETKSGAVEHLCDQVLIPGDPGFVEARDGLAGRKLVVGVANAALAKKPEHYMRDGKPLCGAHADNPTKTVAQQGKTGNNAVKKATPKKLSTWGREARERSAASQAAKAETGATQPAKRLTPGKANPKQMKVKK